jgi:hypothetical protein
MSRENPMPGLDRARLLLSVLLLGAMIVSRLLLRDTRRALLDARHAQQEAFVTRDKATRNLDGALEALHEMKTRHEDADAADTDPPAPA